jgi:hypothetical protein
MNQHMVDVALGMVMGYALARGLAHRHEDSALSHGAAPMAEGEEGRPRAGTSSTPRPGALYPGGTTADAPAPRF